MHGEIFSMLLGFTKNPIIILIALIASVWIFLNYHALVNGKPSDASFKRSVKWLKQETPAKLYIDLLGFLLNPVACWIGDQAHFERAEASSNTPQWMKNWFGFNPFTAASYEKMLVLAFLYPIISFLITWAWTNYGEIGGVTFIPVDITSLLYRCVLLLGISVLMISIVVSLKRWQGWRQWLALLLIVAAVGGFVKINNGDLEEYVIFMVLTFAVLFFSLYLSGFLLGWIILRNKHQAHQLIYPFANAFAFAFAFAIAGVGAFPVEVAFTFAFAFTVAFGIAFGTAEAFTGVGVFLVAFAFSIPFANAFAEAFAGMDTSTVVFMYALVFAFAIAGAFAGVFVGVLFVIAKHQKQKAEKKQRLAIYWFIYTAIILLLSFMAIYLISNKGLLILLLMFALLPVVNASLDWLSLGFTRGLLTSICKGHHHTREALLWAALDLLLAIVFLLLISIAMISVVGLANFIAGKTLIDLNIIFNSLAHGEYAKNFWVIFMLLSTLLPTLVHFALAGGAISLWLPRKWRQRLVQGIETDKHKILLAWGYLSFTPLLGFFMVPAIMFWGLWELLSFTIAHASIGTWLLDAARAYYALFSVT